MLYSFQGVAVRGVRCHCRESRHCMSSHRSLSPSPPPRSQRCEAAGQLRPSEQSTAEQEYLEGPSTATTSPKGASSLARCAAKLHHSVWEAAAMRLCQYHFVEAEL